MSRLDSFIRRMQAQRDCLNHVAGLIGTRTGHVLELGLGNGRTYDHLRETLPQRDIYVFERHVAAHPDCVPDDEHLLLGELHDTLPASVERLGRGAILAHTDIGSGVQADNQALAAWMAPYLAALVQPGGYIISDQPLTHPALSACPLPEGVPARRLNLYQVA